MEIKNQPIDLQNLFLKKINRRSSWNCSKVILFLIMSYEMKTKLHYIIYPILSLILYSQGNIIDMLVFKRNCSSILGSYAFLLSFVYILIIIILTKDVISLITSICLLIVSLFIANLTYPLVSKNIILFHSSYCFCFYLPFSIFALYFALNRQNKKTQ